MLNCHFRHIAALGEACFVEVGQRIHQLRGEAAPCLPCGEKKLTCSPAMQSLPHFAASVFPLLLAAFLFLKYIISSRSGFVLRFLFHFCLCCHLCLMTQSPLEVARGE